MSIHISDENRNLEGFGLSNILKWIEEVIKRHGCRVGVINYVFVDDQTMLEYNNRFLGHNYYTDIITFDYVKGNIISGDIIISEERVKDNAELMKENYQKEMLRVLIHGVHHLLGQGDKSEEEGREMRRKEEESIALFYEMFPEKQSL